MSIARLKDYRGPALFSYGFRPFFFFGSVYAGAVILVLLPAVYGQLNGHLPTFWIIYPSGSGAGTRISIEDRPARSWE